MQLDLMGIKINTETKPEVLRHLEDRFKLGTKTFIVTPYSEFFYYRCVNYKFRQALDRADLAIPDGITVLWLAHFLALPLKSRRYYCKIFEAFGQLLWSCSQILLAPQKIRDKIPEKIPGSDFFWDLMALADQAGMKVFLLGGFGETPEIVANKIRGKFSKINIVGHSNSGPAENLVEQINASGAELLAVAYGPVKQEVWIADHIEQLNVKIAIGVGGTFDYIAGKKRQPPRFVRDSGLEWLYRLITQRRFKRIWIATYIFLRGALRHKVFMSMPFRQNVVGVILNSENKVFTGLSSRNKNKADRAGNLDESHWQLPQGGIDQGEDPDQSVFREIREETALTDLQIVGKIPNAYTYDWPHMIRPLWFNRLKFRGQSQSIYFLRYGGGDGGVKLDPHEFADFRWVPIRELENQIHPMRRQMLRLALAEINKYI